MEVILLKDIDGVGETGQKKNVKDGFANNFLLPKHLALRVTKGNLKLISEMEHARETRLAKLKEESRLIAERISKLSCTLTRKAGEDDKLFGSVTGSDIAEALKENGVDIDKRKIVLKEPIKKVGVYQVDVKLHPEITAKLKVWVVKE